MKEANKFLLIQTGEITCFRDKPIRREMFPSTEDMPSDSFSLCGLTLIIPGEPTVKVEQIEYIVKGKKDKSL